MIAASVDVVITATIIFTLIDFNWFAVVFDIFIINYLMKKQHIFIWHCDVFYVPAKKKKTKLLLRFITWDEL